MLADEINQIIDTEYENLFTDDIEKKEIEEARPYLIVKGLDKYKYLSEIMVKNYPNTKVTYENVSAYYRLDQRITDNYIKYFNVVEEYIRAQLCYICKINNINKITITDNPDCVFTVFAKILNDDNNKKINNYKKYHKSNHKNNKDVHSAFDFFENLDFGIIREFISNMKEKYKEKLKFDKLKDLKNMRNNTHHNRLILSKYSLEECIKNFAYLLDFLPGKNEGNNYKSGLINNIKSINKEKNNKILFEPADDSIREYVEKYL